MNLVKFIALLCVFTVNYVYLCGAKLVRSRINAPRAPFLKFVYDEEN